MFSLRTLTIGQYIDTQSVIHKLDPRIKCLSVLMLMIGVLLIDRVYFLGLTAAACLGIGLMAKLPLSCVLRNVRTFLWLFTITFAIHLCFTPGRPLPVIPDVGLSFTVEGALRGLFFSLRLFTYIVVAAVFTLTTSPIELTDGIESMLKPLRRFRVPAHEVAMMMTISLRFIPTLIEEAERVRKAQLARAVRFTGSLMHRVKTLIPFCVPLFLSAFRRADELAMAMDTRCYRGEQGRTHFRELRLTAKDGFAIAITGAFCVGVVMLK